MRAFVRQSSASAAPRTLWLRPGASQSPASSRRWPRPTPPGAPRTPRRRRPAPAGGIAPWLVHRPAWPRPGPGSPPNGLPGPTPDSAYPPADAACGLSPACRHRNRWPPFLGGTHRLAVDDPRRRGRLLAGLHPHLSSQRRVDRHQQTAVAPAAKVLPDIRPGRQVVGQGAPLAAGAILVEDGVPDLPPGVLRRTPRLLRLRHRPLEDLPLGIAQITGVGLTFHTPLLPIGPLSPHALREPG